MNKFKLWILDKLGGIPKESLIRLQPVQMTYTETRFTQFKVSQVFPKGAPMQDVARFLARKIGEQMYKDGYIVIMASEQICNSAEAEIKYIAKAYSVKHEDV